MSENQKAANPQAQADDTPEQIQVRLEKRKKLLEKGVEAYPVELPITTTIPEIREKFEGIEAGAELTEERVGVAGRVMLSRTGGKICFATIQDGAGTRIQVILSLANVGEEALADYKQFVDLGDHLFVEGYIGASRRGELLRVCYVLADCFEGYPPAPQGVQECRG